MKKIFQKFKLSFISILIISCYLLSFYACSSNSKNAVREYTEENKPIEVDNYANPSYFDYSDDENITEAEEGIEYSKVNTVEIGETYWFAYGWEDDNPFRTQNTYKVKVLDMKKGYVKYYNQFINEIDSETIRSFKGHIRKMK